MIEISAVLCTDVDRTALHRVVSDLGTYPRWLDIVVVAEPERSVVGEDRAAWTVELRGALGPLSRSKRLRMVRVTCDPDLVRFERQEMDDRQHSPWTLNADFASSDDGSETTLTMTLRYGGSLWLGPLDRLLRDEIERSRPRLVELAMQLDPG